MAIPADFQTGTVTGRFVDLSGDPVVGSVSFTPAVNRMVSDGTDTIVIAETIEVVLDDDGEFTVDLPATDDPDITPVDFTYRVIENFDNGSTYNITVPQGTSTDLSDVTPLDPSTGNTVIRTSGPTGHYEINLVGEDPGSFDLDLDDVPGGKAGVVVYAPAGGPSVFTLSGVPSGADRGLLGVLVFSPDGSAVSIVVEADSSEVTYEGPDGFVGFVLSPVETSMFPALPPGGGSSVSYPEGGVSIQGFLAPTDSEPGILPKAKLGDVWVSLYETAGPVLADLSDPNIEMGDLVVCSRTPKDLLSDPDATVVRLYTPIDEFGFVVLPSGPTYTLSQAPIHGAFSGSGSSRQYTPDTGFFGFDFAVWDASAGPDVYSFMYVGVTEEDMEGFDVPPMSTDLRFWSVIPNWVRLESLFTEHSAATDPHGDRAAAIAAIAAHAAATDPHGDRAYTDTQITAALATFNWKKSARLATTANHSLSGLSAIDGVTPVANDRILVQAQTSGQNNGIYVAAAGSWARAADADGSGEIVAGLTIGVTEGTVNGDAIWTLVTDNPITVGSTSLAFTKLPMSVGMLAANNLSDVANAATARSNLGLAIGIDVQAWNAKLDQLALVVPTATNDLVMYDSGTSSWIKRTLAQLKTALAVTKTDVALGNVINELQVTAAGGGKDTINNLGSSLSGSVAVDLNNGNMQYGTLTGNSTFTFTNMTSGKECQVLLSLTQDGTGSRTAAFTGVKWASATAAVLSTAASSNDQLLFRSRDGGTTIYGFVLGKGMA